jgi:hypothetical protein
LSVFNDFNFNFNRAWLVWTPAGLKVTKTIGADCPLTEAGAVPILTMDVWEHACKLMETSRAIIDN